MTPSNLIQPDKSPKPHPFGGENFVDYVETLSNLNDDVLMMMVKRWRARPTPATNPEVKRELAIVTHCAEIGAMPPGASEHDKALCVRLAQKLVDLGVWPTAFLCGFLPQNRPPQPQGEWKPMR